MDLDKDQDDDVCGRVIVSPLLVYSGKLDASWPMPEEFDKIFMHLFEDLDDGKPSWKPVSDDDHDDSMDELLLLASQAYESQYAYETKASSRNSHSEGVNMSMVQLEEHQIGVLNSPSSHSSAVRKAVSVKETSSSCSVSEVKNRTEFSSKASSRRCIEIIVVVNKCLTDKRCHMSKTPSRRCLHWVRDLHTSKVNVHTIF